MKIIKVSADLKLTMHEFPTGSHEEQNQFLRDLIGNNCDIYEHVVPNRLYTEFHMTDRPTNVPGQCVSMLVDEEGMLKDNKPNLMAATFTKRIGTDLRSWEISFLLARNGTGTGLISVALKILFLRSWSRSYRI